jgi:hypothetical protein
MLMRAPVHAVVLLPCPFCGDVGRCGPDGAFYFEHAKGCWISSQRGTMLDCVSWEELDQWNARSRNDEIETIIVDDITGWGNHFGVDTSCVNHEKRHPIWQQIYGLLTKLHMDNEKLQEAKKIDIMAEAERMGIKPHDPIIGLIGGQ